MPVQLSWLEHLTLNQGVEGSSPPTGTKYIYVPVAQWTRAMDF